MPKVSIILPVYNTRAYLSKSIESILNQTYQDFSLILIDDGSIDGSIELLQKFACLDKRVILKSRENKGLVATLNEGLDLVDSMYIAREDSDDFSHQDRLKEQVAFLDANSSVGICGCYNKTFGDSSEFIRYPVTDKESRPWLLFGPPVAHPSVMLRTKVLFKNNLKYEFNYPYCEDYRLWERMSRYCNIANIPIVLHYYRTHPKQISEKNRNICLESHVRLARQLWEDAGWSGTDSELLTCLGKKYLTTNDLIYVTACFEQILYRNKTIYDQDSLGRVLYERLKKHLITNVGWKGVSDFRKCSIYPYGDESLFLSIKNIIQLTKRSFLKKIRAM